MQTLALYKVFSAWRDALANSEAIAVWCDSKYGKPHTLFAGLDLRNPPRPTDCPYIILRAGAKSEDDGEPYRYSMGIGWAIFNDQKTVTENVTELNGTQELDELGQLIIACLDAVSLDYPITRIDYDIDSIEYFPQHCGEMLLEVTIEPAIGGSLDYP